MVAAGALGRTLTSNETIIKTWVIILCVCAWVCELPVKSLTYKVLNSGPVVLIMRPQFSCERELTHLNFIGLMKHLAQPLWTRVPQEKVCVIY